MLCHVSSVKENRLGVVFMTTIVMAKCCFCYQFAMFALRILWNGLLLPRLWWLVPSSPKLSIQDHYLPLALLSATSSLWGLRSVDCSSWTSAEALSWVDQSNARSFELKGPISAQSWKDQPNVVEHQLNVVSSWAGN